MWCHTISDMQEVMLYLNLMLILMSYRKRCHTWLWRWMWGTESDVIQEVISYLIVMLNAVYRKWCRMWLWCWMWCTENDVVPDCDVECDIRIRLWATWIINNILLGGDGHDVPFNWFVKICQVYGNINALQLSCFIEYVLMYQIHLK